MAGLDAVLRNGIKTIDKITKTLQATVTYQPWKAQDEFGAATYGSARKLRAVVEYNRQMRKTESGEEVMTMASVLFVQPLKPVGTTGRTEPIDPRDKITMPDGRTGPIVYSKGFVDRISGLTMYHEIWLGSE